MPYFEAELNQCLAHINDGKIEEASRICSTLLGIDSRNPRLLFLAADIAVRQGLWGYAVVLSSQCVTIEPTLAEGWMLLGSALRMENRITECRFALQKALDLNPSVHQSDGQYQAYINMASIGADAGEPEDALGWLDKALAVAPKVKTDDNAIHMRDYHWNRALALLSLGRWEEGWAGYKFRRTFETPDQKGQRWHPRTKIAAPYAESIEDLKASKSILVHGEQGLGDEILFLSVLNDLRRCNPGARIDIEVESRLIPLVRRSFPYLRWVFGSQDQAVERGETYDVKIPLGDLPLYFRLSDEDFPGTPYLRASEDLVVGYTEKLLAYQGKIIGLAWLGGTKITRQHERSIPLEKLSPIIIGNTIVNLQYGEMGIKVAEELGFLHFGEASEGKDIDGLAALIESVHVVVTAAQTLYHLCGALGKRCVLLAPESVDWRIGVRFGDRLPWYNSVQVIRQGQEEDWGHVAERCWDAIN